MTGGSPIVGSDDQARKLALLQYCLESLDIKSTGPERFFHLQKIAYILWSLGLELDQKFYWFSHGPFSPTLADVLTRVQVPKDMVLSKLDSRLIERFNRIYHDIIRSEKDLEWLASLLYMSHSTSGRGYSPSTVPTELIKKFSIIPSQAQKIWGAIQSAKQDSVTRKRSRSKAKQTRIRVAMPMFLSHSGSVLPASFYDRPTVMVAYDLLGKVISYETPQGVVEAMIVETEAYLGENDPACHAAAGKTKRNAIFFEAKPGTVYVFSAFGLYHCLNVLTGVDYPAGCVLIRAAEPILGIDVMRTNRQAETVFGLTRGPGRLCQALGITKGLNGHHVAQPPFRILDCRYDGFSPVATARIGISKATQYPLRFYIRDSPFVSSCSAAQHV